MCKACSSDTENKMQFNQNYEREIYIIIINCTYTFTNEIYKSESHVKHSAIISLRKFLLTDGNFAYLLR